MVLDTIAHESDRSGDQDLNAYVSQLQRSCPPFDFRTRLILYFLQDALLLAEVLFRQEESRMLATHEARFWLQRRLFSGQEPRPRLPTRPGQDRLYGDNQRGEPVTHSPRSGARSSVPTLDARIDAISGLACNIARNVHICSRARPAGTCIPD